MNWVFNLILVAIWLQGCATWKKESRVVAPVYRSSFGSCSPSDGALQVALFKEGAFLGSGDSEWIAKGDMLHFMMLDPLGRNLLSFERKAQSFKVTGSLSRRLPSLYGASDGFLWIEGHRSPIKIHELACVLSGVFPKSWLSFVRGASEGRILIEEDTRKMEVFFEEPYSKFQKSCAHMTWGGFLGFFAHKLAWCQDGGKRQTDIDVEGVFRIKINKLQEAGP